MSSLIPPLKSFWRCRNSCGRGPRVLHGGSGSEAGSLLDGMYSLQASCELQSKRLINKTSDQISKRLSFILRLVSHLSLSVSRGSVMCYICINPCKSAQGGHVPCSVPETSACPGGREGLLGRVTWIRCLKSDLLSLNLLLFLIFMWMFPECLDPVSLIKD